MKYLFYERSRRSTVYLSPLDLRSRVDKYSTSSRTLIKQIFHFNNTYNTYYYVAAAVRTHYPNITDKDLNPTVGRAISNSRDWGGKKNRK